MSNKALQVLRCAIFCCLCVLMLATSSMGAAKTKITLAESTGWPEWEEAIKKFEEENPDIDVELIKLQHATLAESLLKFAVTGDMPDVFSMLHDILPGFLSNGLVRPLEPFVARDNTMNIKEYVGLDMGPKGLWALPLTINVWFMYYNDSMFAQNGLNAPVNGWTPADMYRLANKLTADTNGDGVIDRWGFMSVRLRSANEADVTLFPFGATLFDDQGKPALDTPQAREAFAYWENLIATGSTVPDGGPTASQWVSGNVGMQTADRVYLSQLAQSTSFDWGLVPLPMNTGVTPRTVGTGHYLSIANSSKNPDAAWRFLKWATSAKGHNVFKPKAPLPGNLRAVPIYLQYWEAMKNQWNNPKNIDLITTITTYAMPPSITRTKYTQQQVNNLLNQMATKIFGRTIAADTAREELQRQLEALAIGQK